MDLLKFLFIEDSLKIKEALELVAMPHVSYNFLIIFFVIYKLAKFISRTKRAFKVKLKTFFLVSHMLTFKLTNQTSKNEADTNFKN